MGGGLGFRSRCIRSCVGHLSTPKIETNNLLNGHHSRDKSHIRQKHAKTTRCSTNIFSSAENSIISLRQTRIFQVFYAQPCTPRPILVPLAFALNPSDPGPCCDEDTITRCAFGRVRT